MMRYEVSVCPGIIEEGKFYEGGDTSLYVGNSREAAIMVYHKAVAELPTVCEVEHLERPITVRNASRAVMISGDDWEWEFESYFNYDTKTYIDSSKIVSC